MKVMDKDLFFIIRWKVFLFAGNLGNTYQKNV